MTWSDCAAAISSRSRFLVATHRNPDGDSIGSMAALAWYLESRGKDATLYCADPVPNRFLFLPRTAAITPIIPNASFDAVVVLDASNPTRLGDATITSRAPFVINIDHHRDNTRFGDINIVEPTRSATGEILSHLFQQAGLTLPPEVATALYAAIMTDTGGFRFSNTTSDVLDTCAALARSGADCADIYRRMYASETVAGMRLRSRIMSTLEFFIDNRVCTLEFAAGWLHELGAAQGDSEGMADYTIVANTVEVGMLLKHSAHETHFSLRSNGRIDVGAIARSVPGGGGHANAAGCTIDAPIELARTQMLSTLAAALA